MKPPNIIVLNSSSPDSGKASTPTPPITVSSSPILITTPRPHSTEPSFTFLDQNEPQSTHSNHSELIELADTSYLEDELPDLSVPIPCEPRSLSQPSNHISSGSLYTDAFDCLESFSQPELRSPMSVNFNTSKSRKLLEKKQAKEKREYDREIKKLQKTQELEEKKNFANVNKNRTKSECSEELVFLFHPSFATEFEGPDDLFVKMKSSKLEFKFDALVPVHGIACDRKMDRQFNAELHVWEPLNPPQLVREDKMFFFFRISVFRNFVASDPEALALLVQGYPRAIVVVESDGRSAQVNSNETTDVDPWFEALHTWRLKLRISILETKSRLETVRLLHCLFFELGSVPYFRSIYQEGPYFTEINVKSGNGLSDTYRQFLMCIRSMSVPIANAIMRHYPTLHCLYEAYFSDLNKGPLLLENIMVDREQSCRKIGPALSKRIYSIFMSRDPFFEPYA